MLNIYRLLTILLIPFSYLFLFYRLKKKKEHPERIRERLGFTSRQRPKGKLVWIHAASVGESVAAFPLVEEIKQNNPDVNILFTSGTVTSAEMIATRLKDKVIHQFMPSENPFAISRFLNHWKPDLAIWLESELWPNILWLTSKRCKIISVNTRMSERSFKRWLKFKPLASEILGFFTKILTQSQIDSDKYQQLDAKNIKYIGNIKFSAAAPTIDQAKIDALQKLVDNRRIFFAASTHPGEEIAVLYAHKQLKAKYPDLLTIIAPRHINRKNDIVKLIENEGLSYKVRSEYQGTDLDNTDIYLADTMGELLMFYSISKITFVGGSIAEVGGHNALEAARFSCSILMGPYYFNCIEITEELLKNQAIFIVKDGPELAEKLEYLFKNQEEQQAMGKRAEKLFSSKQNIVKEYYKDLAEYLS